jgi:hypothetical protein
MNVSDKQFNVFYLATPGPKERDFESPACHSVISVKFNRLASVMAPPGLQQ